MRRTFLTLYTSRRYKSQKQTKPLASEMPQRKNTQQKHSITEKKQPIIEDIKNKNPVFQRKTKNL